MRRTKQNKKTARYVSFCTFIFTFRRLSSGPERKKKGKVLLISLTMQVPNKG